MTFTPKTFVNGDVLPALDLNEMDGNDDHVREEAAYRYLAAVASWEFNEGPGGGSPLSVRPTIDGVAISTATTSTGAYNRADVDISTQTNGVHVFALEGFSLRFIKTPDLQYLTWWSTITLVTMGSGTENWIYRLSNFTLIGHREAKSWT